MPMLIALVDGPHFTVPGGVRETLELIGNPVPGWVFINEGDGKPERHFNPVNVACVIETPVHFS